VLDTPDTYCHQEGDFVRKAIAVTSVALVCVLSVVVSGASAANPNASCNGVLVSSIAGQPGFVADLTRDFHDQFKEAGLPPGFFDAAGAHEHAGGVEECLEALGA
jgi:hypothetical protein